MASITTTIDPARGVRVHKVEGEVTLVQVVAKILEYNAGEVALKVVWDFRGGRVPNVSNEEMRRAVRKMAGDVQDLPERRTALVATNPLDFGLLRTWGAFRQSTLKFDQRVFYDYEEALDWLDS